MTPNQREALRLLGVYTAGRFDPWILMGPAKASCRAHIMSVLQGKRVPQSKAGVTAIKDAFYAIAKPIGNCSAAQDEAFEQWAKSA